MPGGGEFADAVRDHDHRFGLRPQTAHRMAILAMDQFGWALADLIPGAVRCVELGPLRDGVVSVLLPAALLAERDPLPRPGPSRRTRSPRGWPAPPAPSASSC